MAHEYIEMPGLDHGTIIMGSMPNVFKFFQKHVKPARRRYVDREAVAERRTSRSGVACVPGRLRIDVIPPVTRS